MKFVCSADARRYGAIISFVAGHMRPLPFDELIVPDTGRIRPRPLLQRVRLTAVVMRPSTTGVPTWALSSTGTGWDPSVVRWSTR